MGMSASLAVEAFHENDPHAGIFFGLMAFIFGFVGCRSGAWLYNVMRIFEQTRKYEKVAHVLLCILTHSDLVSSVITWNS